MRILVVGAGATGGYFGARLAQAGRDVTFLVRPGRAAALAERGLRLVGQGDDERIDPQLVTTTGLAGAYDVVILSVKATALDAAIADLVPAVGETTRIVPFLNGVAHLDRLNDRFGSTVVFGGVVVVATQLTPQGDIELLNTSASMAIGAQGGGRSPELDAVTAELGGAGYEFSVSPDILTAMWSKWVFIATVGGFTCMMRSPVGDIVACPGGAELGRTLLAEAAATATAAGYPVPTADLANTEAAVTAAGSGLATSMYRDMSEGAPTEVEQILGDLVARAEHLGVPTPTLALATLHLRVYERRRTAATAQR